eukprot:scaffold304691_cov30-Tisochrysis_lutea.AAC.2
MLRSATPDRSEPVPAQLKTMRSLSAWTRIRSVGRSACCRSEVAAMKHQFQPRPTADCPDA